ncbi:MAG: SprT-like domain-containing protein [Campylobacteraceae bacterium]
MNNELILDVYKTLEEKVKLHFNLSLNITFRVDLKGYRLIGQCKKLSKNSYMIRLHVKLLEKFREVYLHDVLTHELAHAVQMELYPKSKPHSFEWKSILQTLCGKKYSTKNKITYVLPQTNINRFPFVYTCNCQNHFLSGVRHNKIVRYKYTYTCKKCKSILIFKEKAHF